MKFNNKYERIVVETGEINNGEIITEKYGFINTERQIKNMMMSGERLYRARAQMFDLQEGDDFDENYPLDPTRRPDFDLADVSRIKEELDVRLAEKSRDNKDSDRSDPENPDTDLEVEKEAADE